MLMPVLAAHNSCWECGTMSRTQALLRRVLESYRRVTWCNITLIYSGMVEKLILIVPFAACVILCAVRDMGCVRDIVLRAWYGPTRRFSRPDIKITWSSGRSSIHRLPPPTHPYPQPTHPQAPADQVRSVDTWKLQSKKYIAHVPGSRQINYICGPGSFESLLHGLRSQRTF